MYVDRYIIQDDGTKLYEGMYRVRKHGLLFIVEQLYYEFHPIFTEDSKWEDEQKAVSHCKLLNGVIENRKLNNQ